MKFQKCDRCGIEKKVENASNSEDYDTITFGSWTDPAEVFDICPDCKMELRSKFPKRDKK